MSDYYYISVSCNCLEKEYLNDNPIKKFLKHTEAGLDIDYDKYYDMHPSSEYNDTPPYKCEHFGRKCGMEYFTSTYELEQFKYALLRNGGIEKFGLLIEFCENIVIDKNDLNRFSDQLLHFEKLNIVEKYLSLQTSHGQEICLFYENTVVENFLYSKTKNQYFGIDTNGLFVCESKNGEIIEIFRSKKFIQTIYVDIEKEPTLNNMNIQLTSDDELKHSIDTYDYLPIDDDYLFINFTTYEVIRKKKKICDRFEKILIIFNKYSKFSLQSKNPIIINKIKTADTEFLR